VRPHVIITVQSVQCINTFAREDFMKWKFLLAAAMAVTALPAHADFSHIDRQLFNETSGYDFDAEKANYYLSAGADINARNEQLDDQTMLILAIKSFAKPEVVQWLLAHGADPSIRDFKGKTALDWATQNGIDRHPEGHRVVAALRGAMGQATGAAPAAAAQATDAPARAANVPARQAYTVPSANAIRAATAASAAAGVGGPIQPGVYECMNQQAMVTMMAFGIIDGSTFMNSSGRRGRYNYNAGTGVLTLEPGAGQALYKKAGPTWFRPLLPNGQLGGFTCPLNRAKSPTRPPW
jgi:hypothetical protein